MGLEKKSYLSRGQKLITIGLLSIFVLAALNWYFDMHSLGGFARLFAAASLLVLVLWVQRCLVLIEHD